MTTGLAVVECKRNEHARSPSQSADLAAGGPASPRVFIPRRPLPFSEQAMNFKRCNLCARVRPINMFGTERLARDHHRCECRECGRALAKTYYQEHAKQLCAHKATFYREHRQQELARAREYRVAHPEKRRTWQQRYRLLHQQRCKAWELVKNSIEKNVLQRPSECVQCKKRCIPEAHHEDYSRPLQLKWLCRACHRKLHRKYA